MMKSKTEVSVKFIVFTLFPELIQSYLSDALLSKAIQQKRIQVEVIPLRSFAEGRYKSIDDVPYGGGDGMVFKASILETALMSLPVKSKSERQVIYLSPQGKVWNSTMAKKMVNDFSFTLPPTRSLLSAQKKAVAIEKEIVLICGRYGGIDQRFIQKHIDVEVSIGDYVLSGGELAALVLIESVSRFVPGVLGHDLSAHRDSFENNALEAPQFTKPQQWGDLAVPEVLSSGNHKKIDEWRFFVSWLVTFKKRPDLFAQNFYLQANQGDKKDAVSMKKLVDFYETLSQQDRKTLQIEELDLKQMQDLGGKS